jgi:hypothetical protein
MEAARRTGSPSLVAVVTAGLAVAATLGGGACGGGSQSGLTAAQLQDPTACRTCHPDQYAAWSNSMHAYASDDPVFRAMNKRAQRDPSGAPGNLCVKCHAPVAERQGLTTDGLNLDDLPQQAKGVTCYFCHSAQSVDGTHNNPLTLAKDGSLFGPFADPAGSPPHAAKYSTLFDEAQTDSANMCGSCHDIVNTHGAAVERTFEEWQATLFSAPRKGLSCASSCHMASAQGPASTISKDTIRTLHSHDFPGVDLSLTPSFADPAAQQVPAQQLLDTAVQTTMCFDQAANQVRVILDNVGAGHGFPSGATPDRRAWVELTAYAGTTVLYTSGGAAAMPLEASPDPDLWLIRDCLQDTQGAEAKMFWQAGMAVGNNMPGSVMQVVSDPSSYSRTHLLRRYPSAPGGFSTAPDRITMKLHLQAIGDDVLADLVATGDLDPSLPSQIARYEVAGGALEWTPGAAHMYQDPVTHDLLPCVTNNLSLGILPMTVAAKSHASCAAP